MAMVWTERAPNSDGRLCVWGVRGVTIFRKVYVCGFVQVDLCKLDCAVPQEVLCHTGYRIGSGADPHVPFSIGRGEDFD